MDNPKIIIYSGGDFSSNKKLDSYLLSGLLHPKIIYIPTSKNDKIFFFLEFKKHFEILFPNAEVIYYPLESYNEGEFQFLLKQINIVFFAGGNTFSLMNNLTKCKNIKKHIKTFLNRKESRLGCESAGAICLSPSIGLGSVPYSTADSNKTKIDAMHKGLALFPFEIAPHYNKCHNKEIILYKKINKNKIYGIYDGSGIVIYKEKFLYIGKVVNI